MDRYNYTIKYTQHTNFERPFKFFHFILDGAKNAANFLIRGILSVQHSEFNGNSKINIIVPYNIQPNLLQFTNESIEISATVYAVNIK